MTLSQTLSVYDAFDTPRASGATIAELFVEFDGVGVEVRGLRDEKGSTDVVRILVPGTSGRASGGSAPTLGIIGRLGGVGARPKRLGLVSDADGAIAATAAALKLATLHREGDVLPGDVIITTHVCPTAPTKPHDPVDFMDSPVAPELLNRAEVDAAMDAVLSIDTTKGNRILNHKGIALSPAIKEGWILRVPDDLVRMLEMVTGRPAVTFPVTMQDITPYGNGIYHLNSILQPALETSSPVVGVAICSAAVVAGSATGASHEVDIALAARFAVEVAKAFTAGACRFYDHDEFTKLATLYGPMTRILGR